MSEIFTFGETMVSFASPDLFPLRYAKDFRMSFAGSESNFSIGVAKLGHSAKWVSRVGDDEFGAFIRNAVRGEGVDVSGVITDESALTGCMFKQRSVGETKVFYYRKGSAASFLSPEDMEDSEIGKAKFVYVTGITPLLSESCRASVDHVFTSAHRQGVKICFDPNIRMRLWKDGDYTKLLQDYVLRADVVVAGLDEMRLLFGDSTEKEAMDHLFSRGNASYAAIKDGAKGALAGTPGEQVFIAPYPCKCIEPIGAGDAFNAGFLCGILEERSLEECGRMGAFCGASVTQTPGDIEGFPDRKELAALFAGNQDIYR